MAETNFVLVGVVVVLVIIAVGMYYSMNNDIDNVLKTFSAKDAELAKVILDSQKAIADINNKTDAELEELRTQIAAKTVETQQARLDFEKMITTVADLKQQGLSIDAEANKLKADNCLAGGADSAGCMTHLQLKYYHQLMKGSLDNIITAILTHYRLTKNDPIVYKILEKYYKGLKTTASGLLTNLPELRRELIKDVTVLYNDSDGNRTRNCAFYKNNGPLIISQIYTELTNQESAKYAVDCTNMKVILPADAPPGTAISMPEARNYTNLEYWDAYDKIRNQGCKFESYKLTGPSGPMLAYANPANPNDEAIFAMFLQFANDLYALLLKSCNSSISYSQVLNLANKAIDRIEAHINYNINAMALNTYPAMVELATPSV